MSNQALPIQVTTKVVDGKIYLTAPFCASNIQAFKSVGGKFEGGRWIFADAPAARNKLKEFFGESSEVVTDDESFKRICRKWYRQYVGKNKI